MCPFALIMFALITMVFLYNAVVMAAPLFGHRISSAKILSLSPRKTALLAIIFSLLLLANWIYRLAMGLS